MVIREASKPVVQLGQGEDHRTMYFATSRAADADLRSIRELHVRVDCKECTEHPEVELTSWFMRLQDSASVGFDARPLLRSRHPMAPIGDQCCSHRSAQLHR